MPRNIVQLWLPDGRDHFVALLEQGHRLRRQAEADPAYTAGMDQAAAALAANLARTGVQLSVPAVGEGFLLGVMVGLGTMQGNPGADPGFVAGAAISYSLRAVDGVLR